MKICTVSDGVKKETIGPFKVSIPKGWGFQKSRINKNRFVLEIFPQESMPPFGKEYIHITYFKEKQEKSSVDLERRFKGKKDIVISSFSKQGFQGQSAQYKSSDKLEFFVSTGIRGNEAVLIFVGASQGKLDGMKKAMLAILH